MRDYKKLVQQIYPSAGCWTSRKSRYRLNTRSEVVYYSTAPSSRDWQLGPEGWTLLSQATNSKLAWKLAWEQIQKDMLEKLEQ